MVTNGQITITKKREHTAQRIIEAIKGSNGLLTLAAKKAGLNYSTVWRYSQLFPSVQQAVHEAKESMLDFTEGMLYKNIKAGDNASIIFYLKTQGKQRGFVERSELTGAEGRPIKMEATIVQFDARTVAAAILEAQRLGISPGLLGGNGHSEDATILSSPTDIQTTSVPESEN